MGQNVCNIYEKTLTRKRRRRRRARDPLFEGDSLKLHPQQQNSMKRTRMGGAAKLAAEAATFLADLEKRTEIRKVKEEFKMSEAARVAGEEDPSLLMHNPGPDLRPHVRL